MASSLQSLGQFFLTSEEFPACPDCMTPFPCGTELSESNHGIRYRFSYVPLIGFDYNRDGLSDQWLDIYIPNTPTPADGYPVIVYAHAANQDAGDVCESADVANSLGIAFVSWESVNDDVRTSNGQLPSAELAYSFGDGDFNRVLRWVRDNAATETNATLNLNHVIVSGASRGARLSFKGLDEVLNLETGLPLVKAALFSQAFPDLELQYSEDYGVAPAEDLVGPGYPPILFIYEKNPGIVNDIHDPLNGLRVMEELQCQGVPVALIYNLDYPLFSPATMDYLLEFYYAPEGTMEQLDGQVIAISDEVSPISLKAPKDVEVRLSQNNPSRFWFKWKQNGWDQIEAYPIRLDCEIRGIGQNSETFCLSSSFEQNYINDFSGNTPTPENYRLPRQMALDACELPSSIQTGQTYIAQARCFIKVQGYDPVSTYTPWSEPIEITIPECTGKASNVTKSIDSFIESTGMARWRIVGDQNTIQEYEVFDVQGRRVLYHHGNVREIDLSSFPQGVYILNLRRGQEVFRTKLSTSTF